MVGRGIKSIVIRTEKENEVKKLRVKLYYSHSAAWLGCVLCMGPGAVAPSAPMVAPLLYLYYYLTVKKDTYVDCRLKTGD